jgi:hypothetical protein
MAIKINPSIYKIIPIVGWILSMAGLFIKIDNVLIYIIWLIIVFACVVLHAVQLVVAIPVGRRAGRGFAEIIFNTLLYGAAWWMPIKLSLESDDRLR